MKIDDEFEDDITPTSLINEMRENQLWKDIRETAKTNIALQEALERVKILYYLITYDYAFNFNNIKDLISILFLYISYKENMKIIKELKAKLNLICVE